MSPSKTVWPAPWTLLLCHGRDPAQPSALPRRSAGVSLVPALSLFFVQTVPRFFTPPLPGLQVRELRENHCSGFRASPQGAPPDGGAMAGVNQTRDRPWGLPSSSPGTCLRQLWLEGLPGTALTLCHQYSLLAPLGFWTPRFQTFTSCLWIDSTFDPLAHSHGL